MKKLFIATILILLPSLALAAWKLEQGKKVSALRDDKVGMIAKLPAKASPKGVSAHLQIECFEHPQLTVRTVSLVTSKATAPGPLGWRYQIDDKAAIQRGPYSRTSFTVTNMGDSSSDEFKGLANAQRFQVTLLPSQGAQWSFDFDVTGARAAIDAVPCKEFKAR
jgi:hypothetical protein